MSGFVIQRMKLIRNLTPSYIEGELYRKVQNENVQFSLLHDTWMTLFCDVNRINPFCLQKVGIAKRNKENSTKQKFETFFYALSLSLSFHPFILPCVSGIVTRVASLLSQSACVFWQKYRNEKYLLRHKVMLPHPV